MVFQFGKVILVIVIDITVPVAVVILVRFLVNTARLMLSYSSRAISVRYSMKSFGNIILIFYSICFHILGGSLCGSCGESCRN